MFNNREDDLRILRNRRLDLEAMTHTPMLYLDPWLIVRPGQELYARLWLTDPDFYEAWQSEELDAESVLA